MKKITFMVVLLLSQFVVADPAPFLVSAASSSGTYKEMIDQIQGVCTSPEFAIQVVPSTGGATENLEQLVNNKVNAAFMHSDIIYAKAQTDSKYRKYKTLVNLYPEEIHVLVLREALEKTGGIGGTSLGAKPVVYKSLSEMEGLNVGAAGGSAISAGILSGAGGGHFNVVTFNSGKEVLSALKSGQIQAAIFVGGAPLPNITVLTATEYKLIPIGDSIISKVAGDSGIYKSAAISYANLQSDSIRTVATSAIIVTRSYTVPKFVAPQKWFRDCFYEHLTELQETPNTHRKWQEIDPTDHGVWEWYEFGTTQ